MTTKAIGSSRVMAVMFAARNGHGESSEVFALVQAYLESAELLGMWRDPSKIPGDKTKRWETLNEMTDAHMKVHGDSP